MAMLLIGCSAASALNTLTPSSTFERDKDVAYGDNDRQTMDIYRAADPKAGAPVIVFVHGGGWTDGRKDMYKFVAEGFTKDGYHVVVPNYRLYPAGRYPDMIIDTGLAINATANMFADQQLVLIGHSAGGYNVLMAAMAPEISDVAVCQNVSGIVSLAAPTGAYPMTDEPYITIFPDRLTGDDAPINRADAALPPVFLVNGRSDETVGYKNAEQLAAALEKNGHQVRLGLYEDMNHIDPVRVLSRHFDGGSSLKTDIVAFIDGLEDQPNYCSTELPD
jgi:acetyl esterase/lipase